MQKPNLCNKTARSTPHMQGLLLPFLQEGGLEPTALSKVSCHQGSSCAALLHLQQLLLILEETRRWEVTPCRAVASCGQQLLAGVTIPWKIWAGSLVGAPKPVRVQRALGISQTSKAQSRCSNAPLLLCFR